MENRSWIRRLDNGLLLFAGFFVACAASAAIPFLRAVHGGRRLSWEVREICCLLATTGVALVSLAIYLIATNNRSRRKEL